MGCWAVGTRFAAIPSRSWGEIPGFEVWKGLTMEHAATFSQWWWHWAWGVPFVGHIYALHKNVLKERMKSKRKRGWTRVSPILPSALGRQGKRRATSMKSQIELYLRAAQYVPNPFCSSEGLKGNCILYQKKPHLAKIHLCTLPITTSQANVSLYLPFSRPESCMSPKDQRDSWKHWEIHTVDAVHHINILERSWCLNSCIFH